MIYGIGRNYAAHAKELGNLVPESAPMVFLKPDAGIVPSGPVKLPSFSKDVQFEVELALKFDSNLEVGEICVANDLTARDTQREAQKKGTPWTLAKGFKQSCGLGPWVSAAGIDLKNLELKLTLNEKITQHGYTKDMIFDVPTLVSYLKAHFPIQPGDIVLTGTPAGVATIVAGDRIVAELVGHSKAQWTYTD